MFGKHSVAVILWVLWTVLVRVTLITSRTVMSDLAAWKSFTSRLGGKDWTAGGNVTADPCSSVFVRCSERKAGARNLTVVSAL